VEVLEEIPELRLPTMLLVLAEVDMVALQALTVAPEPQILVAVVVVVETQ
jgi:hypothetical protein